MVGWLVGWLVGWFEYRILCMIFFVVMVCSEIFLFLFEFSIKVVGGGPTASHFLSTATKSNQKMPQPYDEA